MITNPAVEPPSPSPILDKTEQPYSHSDPFVTTPNDFPMHSQQTEQKQPSQTHEMDPPSPRPEGQGFPITATEDSPQDPGNFQGGGGYYGDSYNNYQQQGYPGNGYPQQGSQALATRCAGIIFNHFPWLTGAQTYYRPYYMTMWTPKGIF